MYTWKKVFIRSAGFGFGAIMAIALIVGLWLWYNSRPKPVKPWDSQAITSCFSDLQVSVGDRIIAEFRYSLESSLDHDYVLPSDDESAFIVLPDGKGLAKKENLEWPKGAILPAHQKISITFKIPFDYNDFYPRKHRDDLGKLNAFMKRRLKEIEGFVILDRKRRYEIKFPKGWEPWGQKDKKNTQNNNENE